MLPIAAILVALVAGGIFVLFPRSSKSKSAPAAPQNYFPVTLPGTDTRPRGIRNNNPTNIIDVGIPWRGLTGNDGRFCTFATAIDGLRAGYLNLWSAINTHGADTIRTLAARWAPAHENDTGAYQESLRRQTGITSIDTKLNYSRDATPLINAIVRHENGQNPYSVAQYDQAYREAGKS